MNKLKVIAGIIIWFGFGYIGAAEWAGHFLATFPTVETNVSACRSSLGYFLMGPIGAVEGFVVSTHRPKWDWPLYAFKYEEEPSGEPTK